MSQLNKSAMGVSVLARAVGNSEITNGVNAKGKPWTKVSLQGSFVTPDGKGKFVKCQQYLEAGASPVIFSDGETFGAEVTQVDGYEKSRDILSLFVTFNRPAIVDTKGGVK